MSRWHVLILVVVIGLGAGVGCTPAPQTESAPDGQADGAPDGLTGQDYALIYQLYARYAQGTDFREADLWLSVFTDDAVFQPGAAADDVVGMEALTEWRAQIFAARPPESQTRHWNSGWVITQTPGGATGRVYFLGVDVSSGQPALGGSGHYEDIYVKTSAGWRIQERRFTSDTSMHWLNGQ